uniref:Uncharacterized protein n=1 Tax=Mustela putorius furo TaxID=9669 RepID=M3Z8G6_MUSPF
MLQPGVLHVAEPAPRGPPGPSRWSRAGAGVWHPPELAEDPDPPPRRPEGRPPNPGSGLPGRPTLTRSSGSVPRAAPVPTVSYCPNLPWVPVANNSAQTRGPTNHTPAFSFGKADLVPCGEDQPVKFFLSVAVGHSAGTHMDPAVRFWGKASRRSPVWPKGSRALASPTSDLCPDPGMCQSHSSNLLLLTVPSSRLCSQSPQLQAEAHRSLWASNRELGPAVGLGGGQDRCAQVGDSRGPQFLSFPEGATRRLAPCREVSGRPRHTGPLPVGAHGAQTRPPWRSPPPLLSLPCVLGAAHLGTRGQEATSPPAISGPHGGGPSSLVPSVFYHPPPRAPECAGRWGRGQVLAPADPSSRPRTESAQVLRLEDLLQGWDVDHGQLPQNGPQHRVQEHAVPEKTDLSYQLGLQEGEDTSALPTENSPLRTAQLGAHLRAAGQGVEEVEEHKAGEGHGGGTWGAGLVCGDLEHRHGKRASGKAVCFPQRTRPSPRARGCSSSRWARYPPTSSREQLSWELTRTSPLGWRQLLLQGTRGSDPPPAQASPGRWRGQQPVLRNLGCSPHPS